MAKYRTPAARVTRESAGRIAPDFARNRLRSCFFPQLLWQPAKHHVLRTRGVSQMSEFGASKRCTLSGAFKPIVSSQYGTLFEWSPFPAGKRVHGRCVTAAPAGSAASPTRVAGTAACSPLNPGIQAPGGFQTLVAGSQHGCTKGTGTLGPPVRQSRGERGSASSCTGPCTAGP